MSRRENSIGTEKTNSYCLSTRVVARICPHSGGVVSEQEGSVKGKDAYARDNIEIILAGGRFLFGVENHHVQEEVEMRARIVSTKPG